MKTDIKLSPNPMVKFLGKPSSDFTRDDIIDFISTNDVEMVNFMYPAGDGRLKTLNFVINSLDYLKSILTTGERVDGSSLFDFVEAGASDLYVIPRYNTAFVDPFSPIKTVTMLCSFFDKDGKPLEGAPEQVLKRACDAFKSTTGLDFYAMGELEYYVISDETDEFKAVDQRGYHESAPFAKLNDFRIDCMRHIAMTGGQIKYGHSEVGNFTLNGKNYEQNEIEFLPIPAREAADQLMIAKWVIRNLAYKHGLGVTFAPKITTGKAGSGLHIHMKLMKGDRNVMVDNNQLSDDAKRLIAGIMTLAPALTAFGNTNPSSYFRLVPHQEAPTNICWGDRNRSVLVRVPLGWTSTNDMSAIANPGQPASTKSASDKQTVEIRSGDCSANVYLYMAGLAVAARLGFEMEDALKVAEKTYVDVNIHRQENADRVTSLKSLPRNCAESSEALSELRSVFEAHRVFSAPLIDSIISSLKSYNDKDLIIDATRDNAKMKEIVDTYFNCG